MSSFLGVRGGDGTGCDLRHSHFKVLLCDMDTTLAECIHSRLCAYGLDLSTGCAWQLLSDFGQIDTPITQT